MSHAPFWDSRSFDPSTGSFMAAAAQARALVSGARPDAIVVIGPDHFRNFFYDAMPPFCIGVDRIMSFGDFQTPAGELPGASPLARSLLGALRDQFDIAVSLHMGVDHGIAQSYACLAPNLDVPLVPVMLACTGIARPTLARCRSFGVALGDAIRGASGNERVVVVGSGGLSHWLPPTDPDHPAINTAARDFAIGGRPIAHEYQREREKALMAAAATLSGRVNAEWDEWFLGCVASNDIDAICALTDDAIEEHAGNGGHEIRTWLAALAAWGDSIATLGYQPQPAWLTGTAVVAAFAPEPRAENHA